MKNIIFGKYDTRIFAGEIFEGKTCFGKDVNAYSLSEILALTSVKEFVKAYEEEYGDWEELTITEKTNLIQQYFETDPIFGFLSFSSEAEAIEYKDDVIKEIDEIENNSIYAGKRQNEFGELVEVFTAK